MSLGVYVLIWFALGLFVWLFSLRALPRISITISEVVAFYLSFQSWADAFRSTPDLTGVVTVYEDLRRKGLEFPMTDLDMLSPIHTPQRVR